MDLLLSLFLNQNLQIAQNSKICVEALKVSYVIDDHLSWSPEVIAWVYTGDVYRLLKSDEGLVGGLHYKINSTPVGWSRADNFKVIKCN